MKEIPLLYIKKIRSDLTKESSHKMFVVHVAVLVVSKILGTCVSRGFDFLCLVCKFGFSIHLQAENGDCCVRCRDI